MTATEPPPVAAGDVDVEKRTSQWQVVFAQLRKNRGAMVARRLILGTVAVAIGAPLLAFNVPILHVSEDGARLPLLSSLFDRMLFEGGVEVFFNLLLVVLPVWLPAAALGRRWVRGSRSAGTWALVALLAFVVAVEAWAALQAKTAMPVAVFGVAFPGGAFLGWSAFGGSPAAARRRSRLTLLSLLVAGLVAIALVVPREESPYRVWRGPTATVPGTTVFPPIPYHPAGVGDAETLSRARKHPDAENWLGCDLNGRDVVSRIVFGLRISLTIGLVGVAIYVLIGTVFGSLAGYYGGKVDLLISRLIEVMICFPTMFLLLTIIAVFESRSIFLIMAAIGFVGWPGVARLVRGEFLRQRGLDYVTAARAQGLSQRRVIFRHVLPNCLGPVLVSATFGIAGAILTESGIAFLGLGDQTAVSWGQMLTTGRASQEWHLILVPGLAIFFVVTVFNLLGEGLRDALDPKLRR